MLEQDFIMLIMNCKKYAEKAAYQKQTWLPLVPGFLRYYHVIGDESLDCAFKFDETEHVLYIKVADDYNSLPKKVIRAYEAVYETFQFKYLFKTDDDQELVNPRFFDTLVNLISTKVPKTHYGGYIVDIKQPYLSEYHRIHPELPEKLPLYVTKYCSGRFYFLSKSAISNLIGKSELIEKEYLEDYAIGFNLDFVYKKEMLSLNTNKYFIDIEFTDCLQNHL
jgi:Galactosyltransferase